MSSCRPVLAAVLLVLTGVGSALAPAVHWAGHAPHRKGNHGAPGPPPTHDAVHSTACPTCAVLAHRAALTGTSADVVAAADLPAVLEGDTPVTPPLRTALARHVGRGPPVRG